MLFLINHFQTNQLQKLKKSYKNYQTITSKDLYLVLDSPGGSISAGKALIAYVKSLPNKVHTITMFAASMAYITAQSLDKRYITQDGEMMSHRASISGLSGQVPGEANIRLAHISRIVEELFQSVSKRVGVSYEQYMLSVYDELWLTSADAVKLTHADEVVVVKCSKSLSGTHKSLINTLFGVFEVEFSDCPLIRGPLSISTTNAIFRNAVINELGIGFNKRMRLFL
ncbi:MAG: hypothetical protein HC798_03980 [Polaribacter sp.]|nr:hypothetical protein [Polaribacter sp.]